MSSPVLAHEMRPGERAILQRSAASTRFQALSIHRKPRDAADALRREQMEGSAQRDRVVIRARTIYRHSGLRVVPVTVYDVLRVAGLGPTARDLEMIASGCAWEQEAVAIATDALAGRTFFAVGGSRTGFAGGAGLAAPDRTLMRPDVPVQLVRETSTQTEVRLPPRPLGRPS